MSRVDAKWNWQPAFKARDQGRARLRQAAERVLQDANRDVPVATGALRASGRVVMDEGRAIIAYDTAYAVIVHERLDVHHPVGSAKWLENAVLRYQGKLAGEISSGIRL